MNHVPDEALAAVDAFGEGLLTGEASAFGARLRSDLRLSVDPAGADDGACCRYELDHARTKPTLRAYGPFMTTIVDGIDEQFRSWSIEPPAAYEYAGTVASLAFRGPARFVLPTAPLTVRLYEAFASLAPRYRSRNGRLVLSLLRSEMDPPGPSEAGGFAGVEGRRGVSRDSNSEGNSCILPLFGASASRVRSRDRQRPAPLAE